MADFLIDIVSMFYKYPFLRIGLIVMFVYVVIGAMQKKNLKKRITTGVCVMLIVSLIKILTIYIPSIFLIIPFGIVLMVVFLVCAVLFIKIKQKPSKKAYEEIEKISYDDIPSKINAMKRYYDENIFKNERIMYHLQLLYFYQLVEQYDDALINLEKANSLVLSGEKCYYRKYRHWSEQEYLCHKTLLMIDANRYNDAVAALDNYHSYVEKNDNEKEYLYDIFSAEVLLLKDDVENAKLHFDKAKHIVDEYSININTFFGTAYVYLEAKILTLEDNRQKGIHVMIDFMSHNKEYQILVCKGQRYINKLNRL